MLGGVMPEEFRCVACSKPLFDSPAPEVKAEQPAVIVCRHCEVKNWFVRIDTTDLEKTERSKDNSPILPR